MEENSTSSFFELVQKEGERSISRQVQYYNLDMIISIGYRVNSKKGIMFRKWSTKVLKEYMLQGYSINQQRLGYLEKTVKLIDIATRLNEDLRGDESYNMLRVIAEYTKVLDTLDRYDHQNIKKPKGNINKNKKISYSDCIDIIKQMSFKDASSIFRS